MAEQKKRKTTDGESQEPPGELAEIKTVESRPDGDNGGGGNGGGDECQKVCVQGASAPSRPGTPPAPPVSVEPTGPIKVEPTGPFKVALQRSTVNPTLDQALWVAIRHSTNAMGFNQYEAFIERLLCGDKDVAERATWVRDERNKLLQNRRLYQGVDAYKLLKAATETFLVLRCGVRLPASQGAFNAVKDEEESRLGQSDLTLEVLKDKLPYLDRVLEDLLTPGTKIPQSPFCPTLVTGKPFDPCLLELIWSYWHEEGMLVQAINALSVRFQNKRLAGDGNPLANLELHPLRPLSNLLWGYVQDEPFRLTVARRTYEYSHHYGLNLIGKAVPALRPADNRSKFLEAFHSLLHQVSVFYKEDADTTVIANGFPLLNGLKEVHMLLAEGAHNQFGDLPWTARVEMLIQQWLLSRRETLEFLRGRAMFPYKEPWMGPVDTLRRLLGWGDTPVTHFRDLGSFGEQILLSIRYGDWVNVDNEDFAKNWARYWKAEIQGYVHAYRAATGVDVTSANAARPAVNATLPAVLLQRRLAQQGAR
jgi:hypothetical protein